MKIVYKNRYGDSIVKDVDTFSIRGTIRKSRILKVTESATVHKLSVESNSNTYYVEVWNYTKGYSPEILNEGSIITVEGIIHHNWISSCNGGTVDVKTYTAKRISL